MRSEETESTSLQDHGVVAVYDYAIPFYPSTLRQWPWFLRLKTAFELADLLDYFLNSPLGPLRISDFKDIHFLLHNGRIKLTDLDDITSQEPRCDPSATQNLSGSDHKPLGNDAFHAQSHVLKEAYLHKPLDPESKDHLHQKSLVVDSQLGNHSRKTRSHSLDSTVKSQRASNGLAESMIKTGVYTLDQPTGEKSLLMESSHHTCQYNVPCIGGICEGFNALHNLVHMNKVFFQRLLYHDSPEIESQCARIRDKLDKLEITAAELKEWLYQLMNVPYIPGYL